MKNISSKILKTDLVEWRKLRWFSTDLKKISGKSLDKLKQSLINNNFIQPFNVWQAGRTLLILDGQYRMKAMQALEKDGYDIPEQLPANFIECISRSEAARLVLCYSSIYANLTDVGLSEYIAFNRISLQEINMEIDLANFNLDKFIEDNYGQTATGESAQNDVPQVPREPRTKLGDLYELGPHRLLCGDATVLDGARRLFGNELAALVFTDPPYGVSYESVSGKFDMIINDDKTDDDLVNSLLLPAFKTAVAITQPNAAFYVWHASSTREDFAFAMKAAGLIERQYIIWAKPGFILGHSDYRWAHEPCFYASKEGRTPVFYGDRSQSTIWRASLQSTKMASIALGTGIALLDGSGGRLYIEPKVPRGRKVRTLRVLPGQSVFLTNNGKTDDLWEVGRDQGRTNHPTQKPVDLAVRAIENSSLPGDIVYDGFLGSGTTLIGAESTGRICYGTELTPEYCDVIVDRYVERVCHPDIILNGKILKWELLKQG